MDEFCAITGVDAETSAMYMEMSGYDLDTAIQLFFSMNDGGGGGGEANISPSSSSTGWPHDWISLLFSPPSSGNSPLIPECWLHQGLQTSPPHGDNSADWSQLSLLQHKNGPCGVLAAYQGYLLTHLLQNHSLTPSYIPTVDDATAAVMRLLQTVASPSSAAASPTTIQCCAWTDSVGGVGGSVVTTPCDPDTLRALIPQYLAPGGVLLLLYSVIHTFGVETLQQQHAALLPLLYGSHTLCSSALMNILLTGEARESLSAYDDFGGAIPWNKSPASVGLLSGTEIELKMKIHDGFKFPTQEVYVLHGRDHFTTLLVLPPLSSAGAAHSQLMTMPMPMPAPLPFLDPVTATTPTATPTPPSGSSSSASANGLGPLSFVVVHFNGLPPAGPAITQVQCSTV